MQNNGFLFAMLGVKLPLGRHNVVNRTVSEKAVTNMKRNCKIFLRVELPFRSNRNEYRHSESVS